MLMFPLRITRKSRENPTRVVFAAQIAAKVVCWGEPNTLCVIFPLRRVAKILSS